MGPDLCLDCNLSEVTGIGYSLGQLWFVIHPQRLSMVTNPHLTEQINPSDDMDAMGGEGEKGVASSERANTTE